MFRFLALSLAATLMALTGWSYSPAQDANKSSAEKKTVKPVDYYPLQVGNQWHYRVEAGSNSVKAISKIAKIETIDKIPLARLESTVDDKVVGTENLRVTDKGVFRYRTNGEEISPPICLLRYPVKSGAKWSGDFIMGKTGGTYLCETAEESVEVSAGKFKAMKVTLRLETGDQILVTAYWFAMDVGFVKQTIEVGDLNITMELEKFVKAKRAPK